MLDEQALRRSIDRHGDTVRRICFLHLKSYADTEDIFQNVFLKYALRSPAFESQEHERAWFIRVTQNACKDLLKNAFRRKTVPLEAALAQTAAANPEGEARELLSAVLGLPAKYKEVIYLFYYEGYSAIEIARILGKRENTIYSLLSRGRGLLKERLGGEEP